MKTSRGGTERCEVPLQGLVKTTFPCRSGCVSVELGAGLAAPRIPSGRSHHRGSDQNCPPGVGFSSQEELTAKALIGSAIHLITISLE